MTPIVASLAAMLAAGWLFRRWGIVQEGAEKAFNQYLFYLALPALTIVKIAATPLSGIGWRFVAGNTIPLLAVMLAAAALWKAGADDRRMARLLMVVPCLGNTAYLGFPVSGMRLGEGAIGLAAMSASVQTIFVFTAGFALMNLVCDKVCPPSQFLRLLLRNAVLWSSVAGLGLAVSGLQLPPLLGKVLGDVGASTLPLALFAIGAGLYGKRLGTNIRPIALVTTLKLAFLPAVGLLCSLWTGASGLPAQVTFLQACMPVAVLNYVVAREFDFDADLTAQSIVFSTLVFFPLLYIYDLGLALVR